MYVGKSHTHITSKIHLAPQSLIKHNIKIQNINVINVKLYWVFSTTIYQLNYEWYLHYTLYETCFSTRENHMFTSIRLVQFKHVEIQEKKSYPYIIMCYFCVARYTEYFYNHGKNFKETCPYDLYLQ